MASPFIIQIQSLSCLRPSFSYYLSNTCKLFICRSYRGIILQFQPPFQHFENGVPGATTVGRALINSSHGYHKSEVGIECTTSEVTGACSEDCATWTLVYKITQSYVRNLNSLACVSLTLLLYNQLLNNILRRIASSMYLGCCSTLMKTYKDTLLFLDLCLATFRMNGSRYPANNLKYCNISCMHE